MSESIIFYQDWLKKALETALGFTVEDKKAPPVARTINIKRVENHALVVATDLRATVQITIDVGNGQMQKSFEIGIVREDACDLVSCLSDESRKLVVTKENQSLTIGDSSGIQIFRLDRTTGVNDTVVAISGVPEDAVFVSHVNWQKLYQMSVGGKITSPRLFLYSENMGLTVVSFQEQKIGVGPLTLEEEGMRISTWVDAQYIQKIGEIGIQAEMYRHVAPQPDWDAWYFRVSNVVLGIHSHLPEKLGISAPLLRET